MGRRTRGGRKNRGVSQGRLARRHQSGKKPLQKKIFRDFYSEHVETQDQDFPTLCDRYGFSTHFSEEVLDQAYRLRDNFDLEVARPDFLKSEACRDRVDLSEETVLTIDGEDAKDFDDAVSLHKEGGKYHLGVHIADVSHFIKENSLLDREALRRGTSVYLIDKVIPMFPEPVSNHLCSLVEGEYRFTHSCFIRIDFQGKIVDHTFKRSVIKSQRRCTYQEVEDVLNQKTSLSPKIDKTLLLMDELKTLLRKKRIAEGSIDFISEEQSFTLSKEEVLDIHLKGALNSEKLIEEFMLIANISAARDLQKYGAGIYRIHAVPSSEKLFGFEQLVAHRGLRMPRSGSLNPLLEKGMNRYLVFLRSIEDPHLMANLSFLLLISMSQAEYHTDNIGHYGLAFPYYTHFTSPIRRYPDLSVHRLISRFCEKGELSVTSDSAKRQKTQRGKELKELKSHLKKISKQSSESERKAVDAEREYHKVKSMRFMKQNLDREMEAIVMKVRENGMFVKILDNGVEGFVSIYDLDPDLSFDSIREIYKRDKEVVYELGTRCRVKLSHLNFKKLFIDFRIV